MIAPQKKKFNFKFLSLVPVQLQLAQLHLTTSAATASTWQLETAATPHAAAMIIAISAHWQGPL
jgi:hypothetical protein